MVAMSSSIASPEVLIKANINRPFIAMMPSIGMDYCIRRNMVTDNGVQCCLRAILNNLRIHTVVFENTENDGCVASNPVSFTSDSLGAKVRLINLYETLQRGLKLAVLGDALPHFKVNTVNGSKQNTGQFCRAGSNEIQKKHQISCPNSTSLIQERE